MRVTNNLMVNKFSRNLNNATFNLDSINDQVATGMKFSKSSQDTAGAIKAFKVRRDLSRSSQNADNIRDIQGIFDQTESTLMGIKETLLQAKENLIQASTGTLSDINRETIANIFENLKDQVFKLSNTNFAGKYIFGGPNTTTEPFSLSGGKLHYNGVDVDTITENGEEIYGDLGLGISFDGSGNLNTESVMAIGISGSKAFGYGKDADGVSENIYNLFSEIITAIKSNDIDKMQLQTKKLDKKMDDVMVQVAGIGEKSKFIEFLADRNSTDQLNLKTKQNSIETIDQAQAIIDYKVTDMAYKAALQMGSKIIQTSLLDFLR